MTWWGIVIAAGVGTFLIRYLPLLSGTRLARGEGWLSRFLGALGLAAIAALIALSLNELWGQAPHWRGGVRLALGAAAVLLVQRLTPNVGLATLVGAGIYGAAGWALAD
ncbi:AzlD domain-containing protein [Chromohalobacter sp. TMW 2.2308]|jgi:branched-subunit amino acid transport protein|uniref:AzlD domain-containing protein n=1 Tax=Chromohalobacter moromii TaxID=2860329 RepID=A0A9X2X210_9GAMM|nr:MULTISPECIES: AzlD domain-containing protein [Chromohalobacter]MCK2043041.1 AzlD domain-containing protein [Chromohalobacter moromii]MCK2046315.1 AzlD domain-containing protein [Chromohalobacter moromii]MCT8505261.1 AzlD domain-containing protein [Chromohalobacter moromii]MCT8515722.1 AzlD domain-containing protein [Chromohalobacter sp. TMW 2.2271]